MSKIAQMVKKLDFPENVMGDFIQETKGILVKKLKQQTFFAVTTTSVYQVFAMGEDGWPYALKIGLKGKSAISVGGKISGAMLSIAQWLQFYIPEGHAWLSAGTSFERRLERVNTQWWLGGTSKIIALFSSEEEARKCFACAHLVSCDHRWIEHTQGVLWLIGENHPTITICHWPELALLEE